MKMCPDCDEYKLYYAQALFKAGLYEPALKQCQTVADSAELGSRVMMLQAAIKYEQDDLMNTRALIDQCSPDDADTLVNQSCVMYKEAQAAGPAGDNSLYEKARLQFTEAMSKTGFQAELAYAIGLCHYQQKQCARWPLGRSTCRARARGRGALLVGPASTARTRPSTLSLPPSLSLLGTAPR